jgi:preprotein translocase subunit SecG
MTALTHILPWIQVSLAVILILGVVLQTSGAGVGGAFGGGDGTIYHTKRGFEKFLFYLTIVVGILFALSALVSVVFAQ